jgi:hypothetical protein
MLLDQVNLTLFSGVLINEEPTTFDQAWNDKDPKVREKCREAISKDFQENSKKEVWEVTKKENIPKDKRIIKSKWILRSNKTQFLEHDWLPVDIVRCLE